ncbi:MAG: ATP-dependent Clp protease proteolytic subunit [Gemmobacter sp.]
MRALVLAAILIGGPAIAEEAPVKPSTDANPVVRINGDTLTYIGGINEAGVTALSEAVRHLSRGQVTKMLVNSGGGDTKAGIYIGSIIADLKPDLTIEVGCFSSCANFIAPAAASITIRENAFLGWHGNDRGFQIVADQLELPLREHLRATFVTGAAETGIDVEAWLDEVVLALEERIVEEAALYKRIGLANDTFAICGVGPRFEARLSGDQLGWGFSIADMARLGLPPVRYEGPGAYEDSPAFKHWLIQLTPEDCLP